MSGSQPSHDLVRVEGGAVCRLVSNGQTVVFVVGFNLHRKGSADN
jgi:hypothetical protein